MPDTVDVSMHMCVSWKAISIVELAVLVFPFSSTKTKDKAELFKNLTNSHLPGFKSVTSNKVQKQLKNNNNKRNTTPIILFG